MIKNITEMGRSIRSAVKKAATTGLASLLLATTTPVMAETPKKNMVEQTDQTFTAGIKIDPENANGLVDYKHKNGGQVTVETVNQSLLRKDPRHEVNLGLKTPRFFKQSESLRFQLGFTINSELAIPEYAYTLMGEIVSIDKELRARGGYFKTMNGVDGGFVGGIFKNENVSLDFDLSIDDKPEFNLHGYTAVVIENILYLSAGGKVREEELNFLAGLINEDSVGFYAQHKVDLKHNAHRGKLILADKFTYNRDRFDLRSRLENGTEAQGFATGPILNATEVFNLELHDVLATKNFAFIAGWEDDAVKRRFNSSAYVKAYDYLMVGLGFDTTQEKGIGKTDYKMNGHFLLNHLGFYAKLDLGINLRTGEFVPEGLFGIVTNVD